MTYRQNETLAVGSRAVNQWSRDVGRSATTHHASLNRLYIHLASINNANSSMIGIQVAVGTPQLTVSQPCSSDSVDAASRTAVALQYSSIDKLHK